MFVGYAGSHAGDVYRMYNIGTRGVKLTRDVIWLGKRYNKWMGVVKKGASAVHDDNQDGDMTEDDVDGNIEQKGDKPASQKVTNELKRLNTFYNLTLKDVVDFAMVGRTDHKYVNPVKFKDAWYYEDASERKLWRQAMRKDMRDIAQKKVWHKVKKNAVPAGRKIIGKKWVFKWKGNGIYRARLVALGYS